MHSMIRKSALAATIAALLNPAVAGALGLGGIEVSSALNEPLKARILLSGVSSDEIDDLKAALGTDEQFSRAGLDRAYALSSLRFKVVQDGATRAHIEITTRDPVVEPFLNFLVDVNWANGRVLREYTVLLDPPVYGAAIRSATAREVETVPTLSAAPMPMPAPVTVKMMPDSGASSPPSAAPMAPAAAAPSGFSGDSYGPVRSGETLWSIADMVRPGGASIQGMMLALLRANPQAFNIDNVNALKTGAVLRIPAASEVRDDRAQALSEVARQHGLWDEYRQSISASAQPQPGGAAAPPMADSGSTESAAMAKTPAADGGAASAELKLVGSGTAGAASGVGAGSEADIQALRDDLSMVQEEAAAANLENTELKSRLGEVEGLVEDMKRLVELREDQLAALQNQLSQAEQASTAEAPASQPTAMPTAEPEPTAQTDPDAAPDKPEVAAQAPAEAATAKKPETMPAPPSLLDDIQAMLPVPLWTILAGLGALLLAFGGMRMARARKGDAVAAVAAGDVAEPEIDDGGSLIGQYAQTELSDDDEDATQLPETPVPDAESDEDVPEMVKTAASEPGAESGVGPSDEEDPLAEVNVYLAYERFDQAEQLVRDAIETHPRRTEYRLKLLEVFYAAKNVLSYESAAAELQTAVGADDEMMVQAHAWWEELETGRTLLTGNDDPGTASQKDAAADDDLFDVTSADDSDQASVDFDLGLDDSTGTGAQSSSSDLDFDLGAVEDESGDSGLDFDLDGLADTGSLPAEPTLAPSTVADAAAVEAKTGADTGLDFNINGITAGDGTGTGSGASLPERIGADDSDLDFDLGTLDDAQQASTLATESTGDSGLDFSLDDGSELGGDGIGAGTVLDFDLGDTTSLTSATPPAQGAASSDESTDDGEKSGTGSSSQDFDLGDTVAMSSKEMAQLAGGIGGESVLDFDLGDAAGMDGDDSAQRESDGVGGESVLDFDLGDTGAAGEEQSTRADTLATLEESLLDFDLDDTHTGSVAGSAQADAGDTAGSVLDFDLGDTGTAGDAGDGTATQGTGEAGIDFDLGDTGSGDGDALQADAGVDLDATGDTSVATIFQDSMTEVGDGSDFDLMLDIDGDAGAEVAADDALPVLDMDIGGGSSEIDTVQLEPDVAESLRGSAEGGAGGEPEFGTDSEFQGVFPGDDSDSAGGDSLLDFDLGTDLDDTDNVSAVDDDVVSLEDTQLGLRDAPVESADDGDDSHTLVLGREASGEVDEMQTKLDLAQAYMDMGDSEGARNLLGEVMADGGDEQQQQAREMLTNLS